jgi:hypothetical protein
MEKYRKIRQIKRNGKMGKSRRIQPEITEITENDSILSLNPWLVLLFLLWQIIN